MAASSLLRLPIISSIPDESKPRPSRLFGKTLTATPRQHRQNHDQHHRRPQPVCAKFDLLQIMGGRGLFNGEEGIAQELKTNRPEQSSPSPSPPVPSSSHQSSSAISDKENSFEKELLGLTGGFPGGEVGLKKFIEDNPPSTTTGQDRVGAAMTGRPKPQPPPLPLLMPGMIVIVKNPANPYYMYCGIVQRITDGVAGVLFEGGNWDKLLTFPIKDLERREKGPPMVNPKSAVLEELIKKQQLAAGDIKVID